jgi:Fur family ferric uptake transcriptional regulator
MSAPPVSAEIHVTAAQRLRADGQRYTTNRRLLVEILEATDRPLTIADMLEQNDGLALSSAYRNLAVLERAGVVHRLVTSDEFARFELAEDLTEHHHHLICSNCGSMADFTISPELERALDKAFTRVAADVGFHAEHHRLDLLGHCADCG